MRKLSFYVDSRVSSLPDKAISDNFRQIEVTTYELLVLAAFDSIAFESSSIADIQHNENYKWKGRSYALRADDYLGSEKNQFVVDSSYGPDNSVFILFPSCHSPVCYHCLA